MTCIKVGSHDGQLALHPFPLTMNAESQWILSLTRGFLSLHRSPGQEKRQVCLFPSHNTRCPHVPQDVARLLAEGHRMNFRPRSPELLQCVQEFERAQQAVANRPARMCQLPQQGGSEAALGFGEQGSQEKSFVPEG